MSRTKAEPRTQFRYLVVVPAYSKEHAEAIVEEQNRRGRTAYTTRVENVFVERVHGHGQRAGEVSRPTWDFYLFLAGAGICSATLWALLVWRLCTGP